VPEAARTIAALVETKELAQTIVAGSIAGVGITFLFSLMIFGAARFADLRRNDRPLLAAAAGGLVLVAVAATVAGIAIGLVVMLSKS
jgi:cell shape-determining protein MreD